MEILEKTPLNAPENVGKVANAAVLIHKLLSHKFDDGSSGPGGGGLETMMAVREQRAYYQSILTRFVERLSKFFTNAFAAYSERFLNNVKSMAKRGGKMEGFDEVIPFLEAYSVLISGLRVLEGGEGHGVVVRAYQREISGIFRRDFGDLLEHIKGSRLIRKPAEDKSYCR